MRKYGTVTKTQHEIEIMFLILHSTVLGNSSNCVRGYISMGLAYGRPL